MRKYLKVNGKYLKLFGKFVSFTPPVDNSFEIQITTQSDSQYITIPHLDGYTYNYTIDYGDGSPLGHVIAYDSPDTQHTYITSGVYTIKIKGTCETFSVEWGGIMPSVLTKVLSWGNVGFTQINFAGCYSLTEIPDDTFGGLSLITDLTYGFYSCTSLLSLPSGLFNYATNLNSFNYTFYNCTSLTSVPSGLFDNATGATTFTYTFDNCTNLTGEAPHLWERIPTPAGNGCYQPDTMLTNYSYIPVSWGGLGNDDIRLLMELTTTSSNQTVTIPHLSGYTYDYIIDYGDKTPFGHVTSYNDVHCTHTYTNSGSHIIVLSGTCETIWFDNGPMKTVVTKVKEWGLAGLKKINFNGCYNLDFIQGDRFGGLSLISDFTDAFRNCTGLTSISHGLFDFSYYNATNFSYAFADCISLIGYVPEIWWMNTGLTGTECFSGCTSVTNYDYIPVPWGGLGASDTSFKFMILTTSPSQSVTIPHVNGFIYDYTIDYGDGTILPVTSYNDPNCTHIYVTPNEYVIKISGTCETFWVYFGGDMPTVLNRVISWGNVGMISLNFADCSNLVSIPNDIVSGGLSLISNIMYMFYYCKIKIIPSGLFHYSTMITASQATFYICQEIKEIPYELFNTFSGVTTFDSVFSDCTKLTSIPSGLFDNCTSVTNFNSVFSDCTKLTSIPSGLFDNCTSVTNFTNAFQGCPNIISIPVDLFRYNPLVIYFDGVFSGCNKMSEIPTDLFRYNTSATFMNSVFQSWYELTTIPTDLFRYNTEVISFQGVFNLCQAITTIPTDTFRYNTKVTTFDSAFWYCSSLSTIPTDLFRYNTGVTSFYSSFQGTPITSIPTDLFRYNTLSTNFDWCFTSCMSLASIPNDIFSGSTHITNLNYVFCYCGTTLTGNAPDLWNRYPSAQHTYCFYGDTNLTNYASIPSGWK